MHPRALLTTHCSPLTAHHPLQVHALLSMVENNDPRLKQQPDGAANPTPSLDPILALSLALAFTLAQTLTLTARRRGSVLGLGLA